MLIAAGVARGLAVAPLLAQGPDCPVRLDKGGATAPTAGATVTVTVMPDPANCNFPVSPISGIGTIAKGAGNTAVVTIPANPAGAAARAALFQIGDQVFRVVQAGANALTPWDIGDVFAGAGSDLESPGVYKTLAPQGTPKLDSGSQTPTNVVADLLDGAGYFSSGCMVDPTAPGGNGHLFTASWKANTLSIFDGVTQQLRDVFPFVDPATIHPYDDLHQDEVGVNTLLAAIPRAAGVEPLPLPAIGVADNPSTTADEFVTPEIQAFEQVVFAADGQFYVGAQKPPLEQDLPGLGHGYLLRFRYTPLAAPGSKLTLTGWWQLDAGTTFGEGILATSGVDQFDVSDHGTIFYTSEDGFIRSFNVNTASAGAIRLTNENGQPLGVRAYGIRILPGSLDGSGNATGDGSAGFLVATSGNTVFRVDAHGKTVARYAVPNPFALNLTPDAQFFWTADQDNGDVYRFHIASGAREQFDPGSPVVFGLCVKREYSAATSGGQCFNLKDDGSYSADDMAACRTPTICSGIPGQDASGQPNDDCFAPGFTPPVFDDQGPDAEGTVVNLDLKQEGITLGGIGGLEAVAGLQYVNGVITGTIGASACSAPPADPNGSATCTLQLSVKWVPGTNVTNVIHWIVTPFTWQVTHGNAVPTITLLTPQPVTLPVLVPATIPLKAEDRDSDYVLASVTGLPPGLSAPFRTWAGMGFGLDITGIPVVDPLHGPAYPVRVDVWDCSQQQAESINQTLRLMREGGATPAAIETILRSEVAAAIERGTCYHAATTLNFTINVENNPPTLTPAPQTTPVNTPVSYQIPANDADGHPLRWTIINLPTGLAANASGLVTGTPTIENVFDVEVTVSDGIAAPVTKRFPWTVYSNRAPVCSTATVTPRLLLWPPNHKLVPFSIQNVTDPDGDALALVITSITQDQPVNDTGDGNTSFDATGIGTSTGAVRAERTGHLRVPGDGRLYQVNFTASDAKPGGTCGGTVIIGVPHDQGQHNLPADNGCRWNSVTGQQLGPCAWLNAPVLTLPNRTNVAGSAIDLQVTATDPDGTPLTYGATSLPPGLSMSSSGLITGTLAPVPAGAKSEKYTATVTVSDDYGTGTSSFTWTVNRS